MAARVPLRVGRVAACVGFPVKFRRRLLALIVAVIAIAGCSPSARGDQGSASVFDSSSGRPVSGAAVLLLRQDGTALEAETDSEGRAVFAGLRPGAYSVRVEKPEYIDLMDLPGRGRPIVISAANEPIAVALTHTAVISGQVLDSQGAPVQGAKVIAIVRRSVNGQSRFTPFGEAAHTDDRGSYRLHGLPPGYYSVVVVPYGDDPTAEVFAPAYYGSADPGEAVFFELQPGETRAPVNLMVAGPQAPSLSGRVSGIPGDAHPNGAAVALAARRGLRVPIASVLTDADGAFVMPHVPPGEYQLTAWAPITGRESDGPPAGANARAAARSVSVSGADLQVDLELRPLVKMSGRLVWDSGPNSRFACGGAAQIEFRSEDGWMDVWPPAVAMNGDGFTVEGLPAGRYRVEMPGLGGSCRLAAVRVGDQAAPDGVAQIDGSATVTLVLITATGEISGGVTTQEGKPAPGLVVLSLADGEGAIQVARLDAEGRYRFSDVLAGTYRLMALGSLNSTDYLDALVAPNRGAKLVVVEAGRKVTSDLRLIRK